MPPTRLRFHQIAETREKSNRQSRAFDQLLAKRSPAARSDARWTRACISILATAALAVVAYGGVTAYGLL